METLRGEQMTTLPEICYYGRDCWQERFGKNLMAQVTRVHMKVDSNNKKSYFK